MRKRPQHRCFPVKFEKFLRIPILKNMCDWLLLLCGSCGASQVLHWSKNTAGVEILVRVDHDFIDFYRDSMKFYLWFYNHFHNTLRLFDVLPNFLYTTSETMRDYYLQTWHIRVASRVAKQLQTEDLRKLGNIREVTKSHRMIAQRPFPPPKWKPTPEENSPKTEI